MLEQFAATLGKPPGVRAGSADGDRPFFERVKDIFG